jgi:hypothetical protein
MRTGHCFGSHHGIKRHLRSYSMDAMSRKDVSQEFCTKHAYNPNSFVPGELNTSVGLPGCLLVCMHECPFPSSIVEVDCK